MTKQSEIANDPKYYTVLDYGFVGLVDYMGTDASIVQAARVSYGDGTKSVTEDRGLIRYLMRADHTSPFEMCQIKLHIKLPIIAMRQWVRHRTASLNEQSGRYSVMTDEFYMPADDVIQPQSKDNKQGRLGSLNETNTSGVKWLLKTAYDHSYSIYKILLGERNSEDEIYDPYGEDALLDDEFPGIARELARSVLPVANYTELYWSQNLHNLMHLMHLRLDPHAQYEIRVFAQAVYDILQPIYPVSIEAFEDYVRQSVKSSRMEVEVLKDLLGDTQEKFTRLIVEAGGEKNYAEKTGMSLRELRDFGLRWGLTSKIKKEPT
jgi:thymidylate synthase (FAD)